MIKTNSKQNFCVILLRIYSINILYNLLFLIYFSIRFFLKLSYTKKFERISHQQASEYLNVCKNEHTKSSSKLLLAVEFRKKFMTFFNDRILKRIRWFQVKCKITCYPRGLIYLLFSVSRMLDKLVKATNRWFFKYNQACVSMQISKHKKSPKTYI
jgi:hypothetical protein